MWKSSSAGLQWLSSEEMQENKCEEKSLCQEKTMPEMPQVSSIPYIKMCQLL